MSINLQHVKHLENIREESLNIASTFWFRVVANKLVLNEFRLPAAGATTNC